MKYMIGVDVGGTFTDFSIFNRDTGELFHFKDSSTPGDPSRAIVKGVQDVLELQHADAGEVDYLAHGTTVGTNALIEKKGARVGLITTEGFRDLMEIGNQKRPSLYDLRAQKPEPLIPSGCSQTRFFPKVFLLSWRWNSNRSSTLKKMASLFFIKVLKILLLAVRL